MPVKITLPDVPTATTTYTEAKANGGLISLEALQRLYSPNYAPGKLLEKYEAEIHSPEQLLFSAARHYFPEAIKILLRRFPDLCAAGQPKSIYVFRESLSAGGGSSDVHLAQLDVDEIISLLNYHREGRIETYSDAWKQRLGYYPSPFVCEIDPEHIDLDVYRAVREAVLNQKNADTTDAGPDDVAVSAGAYFENAHDVARLYLAHIKLNDGQALTVAEAIERMQMSVSDALEKKYESGVPDKLTDDILVELRATVRGILSELEAESRRLPLKPPTGLAP